MKIHSIEKEEKLNRSITPDEKVFSRNPGLSFREQHKEWKKKRFEKVEEIAHVV